jgi:hypothetical protein
MPRVKLSDKSGPRPPAPAPAPRRHLGSARRAPMAPFRNQDALQRYVQRLALLPSCPSIFFPVLCVLDFLLLAVADHNIWDM